MSFQNLDPFEGIIQDIVDVKSNRKLTTPDSNKNLYMTCQNGGEDEEVVIETQLTYNMECSNSVLLFVCLVVSPLFFLLAVNANRIFFICILYIRYFIITKERVNYRCVINQSCTSAVVTNMLFYCYLCYLRALTFCFVSF